MVMFEEHCLNVVRAFCADVVQKANSGHPGAPMGMTPMAHVLWTKFLNYSPSNPEWWNRDRFVLSNGHACALLYTLFHLTGFESYSLDQIKNFRQLDSMTPGHPEAHFPGVETSTGPLGQGLSNAVGLSIAQEHLAATYNSPGFPIFSNHTFVFCGDGCLMEGITSEAASLAGHLGLGHLIVLYDDNNITIDGGTNLAFTENVLERFRSYGWHTQQVLNGDRDLDAIAAAIQAAKDTTDRPSLISIKTTIGFGSKNQATEKVHGSPLGDADISALKTKFGLDPNEKFCLPDQVLQFYRKQKDIGREKEEQWNHLFADYSLQYPSLATELYRRFNADLPEGWLQVLPRYSLHDKPKATRTTSYECLSALAPLLPEMIGGSADLSPSNKSVIDGSPEFQKTSYHGRNLKFGVREHAMVAITNGLSAYGGFLPYGATFLNFLGYCLGGMTVAALSGHRSFYIMTHDSIGLGEDGPTHQPIEKLLLCRSTPNLLLLRPADGNETSGSYAVLLQEKHRPVVLALSRQDLPTLPGTSIEGTAKGAYTIFSSLEDDEMRRADLIIVATGSEVEIAFNAAKADILKDKKVNVVSMPSWELFDAQPHDYRLSVFPDGVPTLSVEAGVTMGWSKYAHASIGVDSFGKSAPTQDLYKHFGLTAENVSKKALELISFCSGKQIQSRLSTAF